jgi:hypothetical protein
MSATYGTSASIFQLAFGLNAVLPALFLTYRGLQASLARYLVEELRKIDPSLTLGEREMVVVRHYVRYGFPAIRLSRSLGLGVGGLFIVALILSFLGLLMSAIKSDEPLHDWSVILFSVFAVIMCPALGIIYDRWIWFVEQQVVLRLDQRSVLVFLKPIKDSLTMDKVGGEMKKITDDMQQLLLEMEEQEIKREWRALKEKARSRLERLARRFRR